MLAVADAERDGANWLDGGAGDPAARDMDDERALRARAARIAASAGLEGPVRSALEAQRLLWPGAIALGALAGVSAGWAGLAGGGDPTSPRGADLNVLWFLQVTLGLHTVFLLLALVALGLALARAGHPLVVVARAAALRLGRTVARGERGAGARAAAAAAFGGRRGALLSGSLGHVAGLGFIAGAVLALLVAATFREQYRFFWKSTLLSAEQAAGLLDAVAAGPRAVGLPTPSAEEIAGARGGLGEDGVAPGETASWAWMLAGALLVWGAGPRAVALAVSAGMMAWSTRRAPSPVSESYRRRALERERRSPEPAREVGRWEFAAEPSPRAPEADDRPLGEPAILGYEIDADGAWPPAGLRGWRDLGIVDGAPDRRRVLAELDDGATRPRALVAVFSRGETPAEAERRFLRDLVARCGERAAVALALSESLATEREDRDAARIGRRTALWREAAEAAGVAEGRIVELDLRHLTEPTLARLRGLDEAAGGAGGAVADRGALEHALDEIDGWARGRDHSPEALGRLLKRIDGRFGAQPAWRRASRALTAGDLAGAREAVTESARSLGRMLPGWMPRHPGWMAATATLVTTGTLSAVVLAGGPIGWAAGAWPLYAAVGAALGELGGRGSAALKPEPPGEDEAVSAGARAAVLHALVLALQGLPDERIAREIDGVLGDAPEVRSAADVPALTAHVRERSARLGSGDGGRA